MYADRGFSLVEVLIALLVLAVGVLGMLALQLHTTRITRDIAAQSLALRLSGDIAETMRGAAASPEMLQVFEQFDYTATDTLPTAGSGPTCIGPTSSCAPTQMAASEMRDWQQRIAQLPGGRLRICRDATPWQAAAQANRWDCDGAAASNRALVPLWIKAGWRSASVNPLKPSTDNPAPQLVLPVSVFAH